MKNCFKAAILFVILNYGFFVKVHARSNSKTDIQYTFFRKDSGVVGITIKYKNSFSTITDFQLPNTWAGQDSLFKGIKNLTISKSGILFPFHSTNENISITHKRGEEITLQYDLVQDWRGELNHTNYFRAIVQPDYFFITGYCGLILPTSKKDESVNFRFAFEGFGSTMESGCSIVHKAKTGEAILRLSEIRNAVFFAGAFRLHQELVGSRKLSIAVYGNYTFSDAAFTDRIKNILNEEQNFWKDHTQPDFLITLLPIASNTTGGTAYHHSFSVFYNPHFSMDQGLNYLLTHEYMHTWIGGNGIRQNAKKEELDKWFFEGFTDYFTYKIMQRINILSRSEYIRELNKVISSYFGSTLNGMPNDSIPGKYFLIPAYKDLPYKRGHLIALLLSGLMEKRGYQFDDFIRTFYDRSRNQPFFSQQLFDKLVKKYGGDTAIHFLQQINAGKNDAFLSHLYFEGSHIQNKEVEVFEIGFNVEQSRYQKHITGIRKESNAYKAGLRNGQPLTGAFSFYNNDPARIAKIGIEQDGKKMVVEYYPAKKLSIPVIPD